MSELTTLFAEAQQNLRTICDFVRFGASQFEANDCFFGHGTDNAWDEAAFMVLHSLSLPPDSPDAVYQSNLIPAEKELILSRFADRIEKKLPASYILNEGWFCDMAYFVDERVLVPRSPIAELIENHFEPFIEYENVARIVDIGTGSGCIACACAVQFPDALVDAIDISSDALDVAAINVASHGLTEQVRLIQSDCLQEVLDEGYDIIVSNPPYVDQPAMDVLPDEYRNEPDFALAGGELGIDFALTIMKQAQQCLNPGGILIVEVGNSQQALEDALPEVPFIWLEFERGGHGVFLLHQSELANIKF